uniref:laccase n=1 Tax=Ananas comosus var. bracteatus TaxID=296719 RepID=A0A6V7QRI2_ANACO
MKCFWLLLLHGLLFFDTVSSKTHRHVFVVEDAPYTRLCKTKSILAVNGQFPGPTLYARRGDTMKVKVHNRAKDNITIHWHGVKQPRNPWSDGPEYITQCPIQPGDSFTYAVVLSTEEGTVWWHAHNDFARATVHGAIVVYPPRGSRYPFPRPFKEFVIVLGEWWVEDVNVVLKRAVESGGDFNKSDAYTINGQPGDFFPCSSNETFRLAVERGKTYLLRVVNAAMSAGLFLSVAHHRLTVVGSDGAYTKPYTSNYALVFPGETMDMLLIADQNPNPTGGLYYMAARAFDFLNTTNIDNITATAVVAYLPGSGGGGRPLLPPLPYYNDSNAATRFSFSLRGLWGAERRPVGLPNVFDERIVMTVSINELPAAIARARDPTGPGFKIFISAKLARGEPQQHQLRQPLDQHTRSLLQVRPRRLRRKFSDDAPLLLQFHRDDQPQNLLWTRRATEVKAVEYGRKLEDPPFKNTVGVPRNGWVAIRFTANNPGVWYLHCHLERHLIWGMDTVLIVKDGPGPWARMLPRPPTCPNARPGPTLSSLGIIPNPNK